MLTQIQIREIRSSLKNGTFLFDREIKKLVDGGMDEKTATYLINNIVNDHNMNTQQVADKNEEELRKILQGVIIALGLVGPLFHVSSWLWYGIATIAAGVAGYFAYKRKPVAGVIGSGLFIAFVPFTYAFYFSGRTSFIQIEIMVPILMAVLPAWLIFLMISRLAYAEQD